MSVEMKDSGIAWIGEIPKHWNISKVSNHYNVQLGKMLQPKKELSDDKLEYYLCAANVSKNQLHLDSIKQMWMKQCELDLYSLKKGDLLVVEGGDVASCAILKEDISNLYFQNALHRVRPIGKNDNRYLRYILLVAKDSGHIDLICNKATISHFTKDKFERLVFLNVPVAEQSLIANFLDKKCAEIDELIALQEQMIAQLTTYKQAVITETVTKGLDPNVKMKDSGVEWIGEIPEHWDKDKIIRMFKTIGSGTTPKSTEDSNFQGTINWLQSGDINGNIITESKHKISLETLKEYSVLKIYKAPFIVVAMYGASVGNISISDIDACVNQACCVMSNSNHDFRFLFYTIKSAKNYLIYRAVGGGQPNISQDTLKNLWLPNPPLSEQQTIATYLDQKCKEIDELISVKKEKIEKLKAYMKSVIYEYVTGKKQV